MFIKEIELVNNLRLMIRGVNRLHLKFTAVEQILLGSNGSGKTSIIQELSPLPANGADFQKGGFKRIVIEHNGIDYQLTNTFNKSAGEHSFINLDTGEELNEGGTQSVQRTLALEIFNFDDKLHELLTDQIKFCNMNPTQRREWLTRISGSNLDFAIEIFNKLKKTQRDEEAVIKHFTNRLNKESDKIPNKQDLDFINGSIDELNEYVEFLRNSVIKGKGGNLDTLKQSYAFKLRNVLLKVKDFLRVKIDKVEGISNLDDYVKSIHYLENENKNIREKIKENETKFNEISNVIRETQSGENIETLEAEVKSLSDKIKDIENRIDIFKNKSDEFTASNLLGLINGIKDTIIEVFSDMIDNSEDYFTREKITDYRNNVIKLDTLIEEQRVRRDKIVHQLYHFENTKDVDCEKCGHTFKPGLHSSELPKLQEALKDADNKLLELNENREKLQFYLNEADKYLNSYNQIKKLSNQTSNLTNYWNKVFDTNFVKGSTKPCIDLTYKAVTELEELELVEKYKTEIFKLEATIEKLKAVNEKGFYTQATLDELELKNKELNELISNNIETINKLSKDLNKLKNQCELYGEGVEEVKQLPELKNNLLASDVNTFIEQAIKDTNIKIGSLVHKQQEMNAMVKVIEDINNSRDKAIKKNDLLKVLIEEINPTDGIIAVFFQQFINQFVEQTNIVLSKIWEHHIELLPCGIDNGGLNYKFPLRVNDKEFGPPDCSKGSNAQVSIVNFAFKIVVMIYLGLEEYPLYLDELAPDLDQKHRINIIHFVRDFVETKRCSQMFMVSHYESGYGAFTNAEILVLDAENLLEIPKSYNKHAIIERS